MKKITGKTSFIDKQAKDFGAKGTTVESIAIYAALLLATLVLPLLVKFFPNDFFARGGDQFIMGPIVNCALVLVGINFKGWKRTSSVIFLPSIIHILNYFVFSIGTLYMLPAIWLGNTAVVLSMKYLHIHKKQNFFISSAIAIVFKVGIVFGAFTLMRVAGIIPAYMVSGMSIAMGINQLWVALIGFAAAFAATKLFYNTKQAHSNI